jgi:hypothetical protein
VSSLWTKVVTNLVPTSGTSFSFLLGPSSTSSPIPDEKVESEMRSIFQYLERNLSTLNEALERSNLNAFLRETYPFLYGGINREKEKVGILVDPDNSNNANVILTEEEENRERESPSLLCRVIWNDLCMKMHGHLDTYGGVQTQKNAKKVRDGSKSRRPLTDVEKRQVEVLDVVLEYLKAFFYCEFDGQNAGIKLEHLEDRVYVSVRELINTLLTT